MVVKIAWGIGLVVWLGCCFLEWRDERKRKIGGVLLAVMLLGLTSCMATVEIDGKGARAYNPEQQAKATAIAQQARDDAAKRELERETLYAQVQTEVKAQTAATVGKSTLYLLGWTGAGVGTLVLCIGLAFVVVAWVGKRATTIYPNKQGQYPLIERRGPGWVVFHDPSRQIGPGAVYRVPTWSDVITERLRLPAAQAAYPLPDVSEPSLLAVASQSNAVSMTAAANRWPKLPNIARNMRLGDSGHGQDDAPELAEPLPAQAALDPLPSRVPLRGLLDGKPSQSHLVLGVTLKDNQVAPVYADLANMVHILTAGASGWGKSQFLKVLAFQLATAAEPCQLVLADMERTTFGPFAQSNRLLYPVVDTEQDLAAVLAEVNAEMTRRKELYSQYPEVDNLPGYNARADAPMTPWVVMIDEATAFLQDGQVADGLKTLVRRGRKFGLWVTAGGQTFGAKDVDTATSLQFGTRVQFRAPVKSAAQTLVDNKDAKSLECPGRGIIVLPGQDAIRFQAPYIANEQIIEAVAGGHPARPMPVVIEPQADDEQAGRIRDLAAQGKSKREIQYEVFGYQGGKAFDTVSRVLAG